MARAGAVAVATLSAVMGSAAASHAADFCVAPASGCAGGTLATLQSALDTAKSAIGPDTVRLPAGTVSGPGSYTGVVNPDNTVEVVGAGRGATTITSAAAVPMLEIDRSGSSVHDLAFQYATPGVSGQTALLLNGTAERIDVHGSSGSDGNAIGITGTLRDAALDLPAGHTGIAVFASLTATVQDVQVSSVGATGIHGGSGASVVVRRARVRAGNSSYAVDGQAATMVLSSSLLQVSGTGTGIGTTPPATGSPATPSTGTVTVSNVTVLGDGGACQNIAVGGVNTGSADATENVTVANSILRGCQTSLVRSGSPPNKVANLTVLSSDVDTSPGAVSASGPGTLSTGSGNGNVNIDPRFVGAPDYHLLHTSPLLDLGLTNPLVDTESTTDLDGLPRVVDGNGDGTAKRDLGAFEYQRRAPVLTAVAGSPTAELGAAVMFNGTVMDPDPGDTVGTMSWRFDDGATADGVTVSHAFSTAGVHMATLSVTDVAGVTGTAAATVTVLAAAAAKSVSLSPATFRAASSGASVAAKKRKRPPIGTKVTLKLTRVAAAKLTVESVYQKHHPRAKAR